MTPPTPDPSAASVPHYVFVRTTPQADDPLYLVLKDLRDYLQRFYTDSALRVLDYGAGDSPYRCLFPQAEYRRADYVPAPGLPVPGLDYIVDDHSRIPERDERFDLVLSTQVAEHVSDPATYFAEARRVLRPGGRIVVTTYGIWQDHGVPFDFQRWTGVGLARDLALAGFVNISTAKLTAGPRAHLFLLLEALAGFADGRTWWRRRVARSLQWFLRRARPHLHRWSDRHWSQLTVVDLGAEHGSGPNFYMGIAATAERPGG